MRRKIFDLRMSDGSRSFADLPEVVSFAGLHNIAENLEGARITGFLDAAIEVWLDFDYRGERFSINNQNGEYWFFVENHNCVDEILLEVINHFESFFEK